MNDAMVLDFVFFVTDKGKCGVVKVLTDAGVVEYRVGVVDGLMEQMDVLQLVAWGVPFPKEAGKKLLS